MLVRALDAVRGRGARGDVERALPAGDDWTVLAARDGDRQVGVPRTRAALDALLQERERGWEHLSWASLLASGIVAQDRRLSLAASLPPDREVDDYPKFAHAVLERVREITMSVVPALDASAQVRAFGVQGEPGSHPDIVRFADQQLDLHDDAVMLSEDLHRVHPPDHLERAHATLEGIVDSVRIQIRDYFTSMVRALDSLPARLASGESVNLDLTLSLVLDVDPVAVRRLARELGTSLPEQ